MVDALQQASAIEQAMALQRGDLSSEQLVQACLDTIEQADGSVNAVIALDGEAALAAARESDRRRAAKQLLTTFDGLPFGVKDNIDVHGLVTTGGMPPSAGYRTATQDAAAVARLREAGCIPLAKLNLHQGILGASNHNIHQGHCYNPIRAGYSPGGSSGGSAAAVAAGYCSFALGSDTLGSVRIPAAYCGVPGYKPSVGAVSTRGTLVVSRRLDHVGAMARSLADFTLLRHLLCVADPLDLRSRQYPEEGAMDYRQLRIHYPQSLTFAAVDASIDAAFCRLLQQLREAGHELIPVDLSQLDLGALRRAGLLVCEADMLTAEDQRYERSLADLPQELAGMLAWARTRSALQLAQADRLLDEGARQMLALLQGADVYLSPTTPQLAFPMSDPVPVGQADLTALANMAGVPAVTLPMPVKDSDLPAGCQLVGHLGRDQALLAAAALLARDSGGLVNDHMTPI